MTTPADWLDSFFGPSDVGLNGATVDASKRSRINFIPGTFISLTVVDNPGTDSVDVTITASPGSGVTWAGDLAGSSNSTQVVSAITGGTGNKVAVNALAHFDVGTNAPTTGGLWRTAMSASADIVFWRGRNSANSADINYLVAHNDTDLYIGDGFNLANVNTFASTSIGSNAPYHAFRDASVVERARIVNAAAASLLFAASCTSVTITQSANTTPGATGATMSLSAQAATGGTNSTGGDFDISSGIGQDNTFAGYLNLFNGTFKTVQIYPINSDGGLQTTLGSTTGYAVDDFLSPLQTTNATPTTIYNLSTAANEAVDIQFTVVARDSSGNVWRADFSDTIKNASGTVSRVGSLTGPLNQKNDTALASVAVTTVLTGSHWEVQVTGIAATTINWSILVQNQHRN